ncbi:gluconate 2-dehydrogenase subunit 3 family protein [Hirschia litorea]|uniref:Gluconate 2-dehydrogenase subunit 3 family protein n=1 Tax=Hirschia litorea TaxID=1199156 RepID=A0ABW2IPG9_9PROT
MARLTRRFFLGGSAVAITAAGISGCRQEDNGLLTVREDGQFFNAYQLTVLQDVSEIMIPRTNTPGAIDAQVASFVDSMMLSWASGPTQMQFLAFLKALDTLSLTQVNKPYTKISQAERTTLLKKVDENAFSTNPSDVSANYKRVKALIFHIYYTSEEAGRDYVPVPGQYNGNLTLAEYENLMNENAYGR